jgi:hypothetical protein
MTLEQDKLEGQAAVALKNDPAFSKAIALARAKVVENWIASKTPEEREQLWHSWHAIARVLDQLDVVEGRGHIAQAASKQHAVPANRAS